MSKRNRTEEEEILKNEMRKIEQNIGNFKKDIEIIKYLANNIEEVATSLSYGIEEVEMSVKSIKTLLSLDDEDG